MTRPWDDILSDTDRAVLEQSGYNAGGSAIYDSRSLGKRPAVMVIDMQRMIVAEDVPILEAVQGNRIAIGERAHRAVERITPFLTRCREAGMPVLHTRIMPIGRNPEDSELEIVDALAPQPGDIVFTKQYPSAFYKTPLLSHLVRLKVDTLILVGNTTSGCIRATAVDARQHGFKVAVPQDFVFDRIEASHKIGLLDLWMKYAAVPTTDEIAVYIQEVCG